jgi:hypothetical protein
VQNYQKTQIVTQLKKNYSAISNTTNLAIADNGPITGWNLYHNTDSVPGSSEKPSENFANTYLVPYLKVSKNCGVTSNGDCIYKYYRLNNDGGQLTLGTDWARFFLTDGTFIAITTFYAIGTDGKYYKDALVLIDANGLKGPNKFGKDLFEFKYIIDGPNPSYNGKLISSGGSATRDELLQGNCSKTGKGDYCSTVIMKDGWQIKDDYPWN